jgi:PAS domain S-box-containing protein
MANPLAWLLDSGQYMPHGHCYLWQPGVLWLHVVADALIATSYLAIPAILYYFVKRRRHEIPYWWMPALFGAFILLCGATHALGIWTIWNPDYRLDGAVKLATGVASAGTALSLGWLMPRVLLLQTPAQLQRVVDERTAELEALARRLREANEAQARTELALRRQERRYRLAAQALRGYLYEIDLKTGITTRSSGFETLLGYAPSDFPPRDGWWRTRVHPDDWPRIRALWDEGMAGGIDNLSCRYRAMDAAGEYHWLWDHALFVRDAAGEIEQIVGNVIDVSEQERARQVAAESDARFRRIADAMPDIVFVHDADGNVEYVNPRWREYTGLERADPPQARSVVWPEDWEPMQQAWAEAQRGLATVSHEFRMTRQGDGATHWFLVRAVPVRDPDGRVRHWVGSSTDIDAQKRAQQALTEADRRKDEFLATLAHELRNPLAPIRYALRLLEPGTPGEMAADARQMITRQLALMARLLDDLLDVSRITRGRLELRAEVLDLRTIVAQAADTVRPLLEALRHALCVHLPDGAAPVCGDATRLAQIIGNLLNNAAKYTEPGGHVEVGVELEGDAVLVTVQDDGTGLEPDELSTIFELFARADAGKRMQAGLGIGLSLSRQLAELHGGQLDAASAGRGLGSTFTLRLPRVAAMPAVQAGSARPDGIPAPAARQARVLVVDDNVDAAEALSQVLELSGYLTRTVNDGLAATEVAELMRPDIVLLDIGLPKLNGHEVARWIRSQPWGVETRLVAITGWGQERDRERSREAGFDVHLTKPVDPDALLALVATLDTPRSATA